MLASVPSSGATVTTAIPQVAVTSKRGSINALRILRYIESVEPTQTPPSDVVRVHVAIRGAVQGVGFRPFVYRLAHELGLRGWVNNSAVGVFIEAEGSACLVRAFTRRLESDKPAVSFIQSFEATFLDPIGYSAFEIRASSGGEKRALVMPDLATCPACIAEVFDPGDRRYGYPFTNCTNCGPRFSIIAALPYDRASTTMRGFAMCADCDREYHDPSDRRFHAQPNACPACGPQLALWNADGDVIASRREAMAAAASALRDGKIVAVKGLGGFHLMVDARNEDALRVLRLRKRREEKPFALMVPNFEHALLYCAASEVEQRLLRSPECPIVLLRRRSETSDLAPAVAPGNPWLGVMLPYTPLHHLLMAGLGSRCRDQWQPFRRAHLHRRARGARTRLGGDRRRLPRSRPAHRAPCGRLDGARGGRPRTGAAPRARLRTAALPGPDGSAPPSRWADTSRVRWPWAWGRRSS